MKPQTLVDLMEALRGFQVVMMESVFAGDTIEWH
jgi:hypothetical protein